MSKKMIDNNFMNIWSRYSGITLGILTAILMSISDIFIKKARLINALEQTTFRYALQLVVMFVIARFNHASLLGPKENRVGLVLRGLFGALNLISYNYCLKLLNPSDATALVYCNVVFVAILAHVYLNEQLTIVHFLSISLTLTGHYYMFYLS
jgi:drug/metabolite transporter (DMT)-like permease